MKCACGLVDIEIVSTASGFVQCDPYLAHRPQKLHRINTFGQAAPQGAVYFPCCCGKTKLQTAETVLRGHSLASCGGGVGADLPLTPEENIEKLVWLMEEIKALLEQKLGGR